MINKHSTPFTDENEAMKELNDTEQDYEDHHSRSAGFYASKQRLGVTLFGLEARVGAALQENRNRTATPFTLKSQSTCASGTD